MTNAAIRYLRMLMRYTACANARLLDALARPPVMDLPVFLRDAPLPLESHEHRP